MSKNKLGSGAASLLGALGTSDKDQSQQIAISRIKPNPQQPRTFFSEEKLQELADSIKENGILQPLLVEPQGLEYLLIAGERRLRAAQIAGLQEVPVIIKKFSHEKKLEIALIENIQREDLNPIEQARAYDQLLKLLQFSHEELAKRLGKSRSAITNTLRLLNLSEAIQDGVIAGKISAGHARSLLSIENKPELQKKLYEHILKEEISVRQTEEYIKSLIKENTPNKTKRTSHYRPQDIIKAEKKLMENLGVKLQIKGDENRGTIAIRYHSKEKLQRIISLLEESNEME
ncbi:ParB/RepB/Spo0J family partition protein [Entomospira entomophila]|uniref:ParB/RepB/Spo0J family partition protein n=1 Tax=Entomospira entomophila TaxID=2719988 RepID=A0A968G964_9SPIO|nr:ParB/RepB/Spo0J family partition protein [Entomospira entomophilus]NIZ40857.1 ParB/RepB/Spo0J family partition protein [Entomospira entomophilus]WDI35069.1 ParB/RepB/Spo0J family partition protein [Entomospira entomophilus]